MPNSPLYNAAKSGDPKLVEKHLTTQNINERTGDNRKRAALHAATEFSHPQIVTLLLSKMADKNIRDIDNKTPLHIASTQENIVIAQLLIQGGVSLTAVDSAEKTALHEAAHKGNITLMRTILNGCKTKAEKFNLIQMIDGAQKTALHYAASQPNPEAVALLMNNEATVDVRDDQGKTPLHYSTIYGFTKVVGSLIDQGADLRLKSNEGYNAAAYAALFRHQELALYLQEREFNPLLQQQILQSNIDSIQIVKPLDETEILNKAIEIVHQELARFKENTLDDIKQHIRQEQETLEIWLVDNVNQQKTLQEQILELHQQIKQQEQKITQASDQLKQELQTTLEIQNLQLNNMNQRQQVLLKEHANKEERRKILEKYKAEPNLFLFYHTLQVKLEEVFISCKSAVGGFTEISGGSVADAKQKIELLGEVISLAPLLGNIASYGFRIISAIMDKVDHERQANTAKNISALMTLAELKKACQYVGQQLTDWCEPQLMTIITAGEEQNLLAETSNSAQKAVTKSKKAILKATFQPAAQKVAEFATLLIIEALQEPDNFNNESSLEVIFVQIVTHYNSPLTDLPQSRENAKKIKDAENKISKKLGNITIKAKVNNRWSEWHLWEFYFKPGIITPSGDIYSSNFTNTAEFGYFNGTAEAATARKLQLIGNSKKKVLPPTALPQSTNANTATIASLDSSIYELLQQLQKQIFEVSIKNDALEKRVFELEQQQNQHVEKITNKVVEEVTTILGQQSPTIKNKDNNLSALTQFSVIKTITREIRDKTSSSQKQNTESPNNAKKLSTS